MIKVGQRLDFLFENPDDRLKGEYTKLYKATFLEFEVYVKCMDKELNKKKLISVCNNYMDDSFFYHIKFNKKKGRPPASIDIFDRRIDRGLTGIQYKRSNEYNCPIIIDFIEYMKIEMNEVIVKRPEWISNETFTNFNYHILHKLDIENDIKDVFGNKLNVGDFVFAVPRGDTGFKIIQITGASRCYIRGKVQTFHSIDNSYWEYDVFIGPYSKIYKLGVDYITLINQTKESQKSEIDNIAEGA